MEKGITINKATSLKSRKQIEQLFVDGKIVKKYPLLVRYTINDSLEEGIIKIGFSVSKKKIRKAVDRNRIKRQMREGFKNNNALLINTLKNNQVGITVMYIYTNNTSLDSTTIHKSIQVLNNTISKELGNVKRAQEIQ